MRRLLGIILILAFSKLSAQDSLATDTSYLSLEQMLKMTLSYHPVVKQADLINQDAEARLKQARGGLDPKLELDYSLKDFKEKEYYNLLNTTFKIPTWVGIDPKVEFSRNKGEFVNDQLEIPVENDYEQVAVGFSVPIGKGLFFDERRNAIRQADAFTQIAAAEQVKETNKILLTVIKDYWNWYLTYQRLQLLSQAIDLAENLFDRTLIDYEYGEAAVVDTLQAKINYQKRTVDFRKAQLDFELAKLNLAKHLWSENLVPLELQQNVLPDSSTLFQTPSDRDLKEGIDFAVSNHPEINKLTGKREQLDADIRWARESLKPQIDLSYSLIDAPVDADLSGSSIEFGDNYKMGVDFSFPILLRKERGKLQQTRLKIQSNEYELAQNQLEIKNEVLGKYAQSVAYQDLLDQYSGVSSNYRRLLDAEIVNLQNGETDLFKLNIQQDKFIEAQTDFYDAFTKWEKSKAEYYHMTGMPLLGLSDLFEIATNQ
ncbi:MAG: TolC family protein [Ekhidna sp.]|uniref:TolC family protein n=1 Tax=Ekhidna sp. TaxID=2608089 RepID=UPI0032EC8E2B